MPYVVNRRSGHYYQPMNAFILVAGLAQHGPHHTMNACTFWLHLRPCCGVASGDPESQLREFC